MNYISYIIVGGSHLLLADPNEIGNPVSNWPVTLNMLGQFFFLIIVFICIVLMAIYSLKFASRFRNYSGGNRNLRIIETRALGPNNYVHLVKAGNKHILVGSSKENVTFLTEIDNESVVDALASADSSKFQEQLANQIKKLFSKKTEE